MSRISLDSTALQTMLGLSEADLKTCLFTVAAFHSGYTRLTYQDIADGIIRVDGRLVVAGTGLCHKTIAKALISLADKRYIRVRYHTYLDHKRITFSNRAHPTKKMTVIIAPDIRLCPRPLRVLSDTHAVA